MSESPIYITATEILRRHEEKMTQLNEMLSQMTPEEQYEFFQALRHEWRGLMGFPTESQDRGE